MLSVCKAEALVQDLTTVRRSLRRGHTKDLAPVRLDSMECHLDL
jgi:hypothetical protein